MLDLHREVGGWGGGWAGGLLQGFYFQGDLLFKTTPKFSFFAFFPAIFFCLLPIYAPPPAYFCYGPILCIKIMGATNCSTASPIMLIFHDVSCI